LLNNRKSAPLRGLRGFPVTPKTPFLGCKGQFCPLHSAAEIRAAFKIVDFKGPQASPTAEKLILNFSAGPNYPNPGETCDRNLIVFVVPFIKKEIISMSSKETPTISVTRRIFRPAGVQISIAVIRRIESILYAYLRKEWKRWRFTAMSECLQLTKTRRDKCLP
jgi:hypothetical protein